MEERPLLHDATKATSTISSRLLVEGGYSSNVEYFTGKYQPGVEKGRGSPEWFTQTGHEELTTMAPHPTDYRYWGGVNTPTNGTTREARLPGRSYVPARTR